MHTTNSFRLTRRRSRWLRALIHTFRIATVLSASATSVFAQNSHAAAGDVSPEPRLHVSPRWKECSIQLDATLTQSAWRQFSGEAGVVAYFRPLVDAQSMGRGRWELSALQWKSGINDHDAAWNDTFVHPDSTHWLFEGGGLTFPGLTARVGVTDRTDVGVYFTKNPNANYGFYAVQVQQNLVGNDTGNWSAAARVNLVSLFGPEDVDLNVYGADLVASRRFRILSGHASLSPYAVVSATLSRSHERSALVTLSDEKVVGTQAAGGVLLQAFGVRVAMEYGVAKVPNVSLKVGIGRGR